ncbi:MAG: sporulation protein [Afipia sp. 62-7]|nr:SPOR domain-containing protein [Afipia sp.]OJU20676.1 MAG: sporulation protein [Afipia sp. 62-7]
MANQYRDRPFPADDDYGRDDSRSASQPRAESDPLAELARLIGQSDPMSTFGREQRQPQRPAPRAQDDYDQYAAPQPRAPQAYDQDRYAQDRYAQDPYAQEHHGAGGYASNDAPEPYAEPQDAPASRPSWLQNLTGRRSRDTSYRADEQVDQPYAAGQYDPAPVHRDPHFDHSGYEPLPQARAHGQQMPTDRYDDVLYGAADNAPAAGYAQDEVYGAPYDQSYGDGYEQAEPKQRRGGTMTVIVVLLLAIVGTGAAFAYRTFIGSPRSGEPPVIKADTGPNKVIPPGAGDSSGKQITDRVGDKSTERMVSREEQPVDVNARTNPNAGPRVVFPPLTQNANPPTVASASTATRPTGAGVGNGTLQGGEEPRKIRTLSIRPGDQTDATAAAPGAALPSSPRAQAPQPRAAAPASAPTGSQANAPMSLSPQPSAPAEAARPKVAALTPSGGAAGAYVQVSSQRSEADARASFRALQGKYSGILGSRSATIHRADIAGKGTFYRAMVGPFGSGDEAAQFCMSLKSAGGQCVVQRN